MSEQFEEIIREIRKDAESGNVVLYWFFKTSNVINPYKTSEYFIPNIKELNLSEDIARQLAEILRVGKEEKIAIWDSSTDNSCGNGSRLGIKTNIQDVFIYFERCQEEFCKERRGIFAITNLPFGEMEDSLIGVERIKNKASELLRGEVEYWEEVKKHFDSDKNKSIMIDAQNLQRSLDYAEKLAKNRDVIVGKISNIRKTLEILECEMIIKRFPDIIANDNNNNWYIKRLVQLAERHPIDLLCARRDANKYVNFFIAEWEEKSRAMTCPLSYRGFYDKAARVGALVSNGIVFSTTNTKLVEILEMEYRHYGMGVFRRRIEHFIWNIGKKKKKGGGGDERRVIRIK